MRRFLQDKGRTSAPQVWEVAHKGNAVTLTWGQLGGAMQQTTQTFEGVNIGKANEKSPKEVAVAWAEKQILLRTRKGYREVDLATNQFLKGDVSASEIDWEIGLPLNLRFFKPQNSLNAHCEKLLRAKKARMLRKRDGAMHSISISYDGGLLMYSSTMQTHHKDELGVPWFQRFGHLAQEIANMHLPGGTVLLGELCTTVHAGFKDQYGMPVDDFEYVSSITKSLTPVALHKQQERGLLGFCIWDIGFLDGVCLLQEWTADQRYAYIGELLNNPHRHHLTMPEIAYFTEAGINIQSPDAVDLTMDYVSDDMVKEAIELAKTLDWEGWVVVDGEAKYDDKSHNFHGKADRPKFVCKLKPKFEADFIARWDPANGIGAWGKGKKSKGVGAVQLYLWDPELQEEVPISETGGGLTDEDVVQFANPKLYPMVWTVEFSEWTPKGSLRHPNFLRPRTDKTPEECTLDQRPSANNEEEE
jgi:predicted DNA-binding WGR domain protein